MAAQLISIEQAREQVLAAARPLGAERISVTDALGRVLAENLEAAEDVPPFASSAMDGYAVHTGPGGRELRVVGESRAGAPVPLELSAGEAIRISTGAAVPAGAEAVIRQEDTVLVGAEEIRLTAPVSQGENIRPAGEVMAAGSPVLAKGAVLGPNELAAAISGGAGEVLVALRPRARVVATGDELRAPGEPLEPGQIHDSNGPMLTALARGAGAEAIEAPPLPDDPVVTEEGLRAALQDADLVIVAGGVSVGPHDHVKPALTKLGVQERFWRVALQPGKPTWFGVRGAQLVFGLPGNPVSAAVTFALFVAPAIAALQDASPPGKLAIGAVLGESVRQSPDRAQALRVRLEHQEGRLVAIPNGPQGSHVITSLLGASALALVPQGEGALEPGTPVALYPLGVWPEGA